MMCVSDSMRVQGVASPFSRSTMTTVFIAHSTATPMFPPCASGTSAERTSRLAGATPTVPCIGSRGSSASMSLSCARNIAVWRVRSSCQIQTVSGSGGCNVAVVVVDVSAPNSGTVVDAAQSRAGSTDTKCTATVSPGSAPST